MKTEENIELVRKARQGDQASRNRLAEQAHAPLKSYVYRITLDEELAQEIVQESILEMLKVLGKLKKADRFWSWLCGIALNKTRRHYRTQKSQRTMLKNKAGQLGNTDSGQQQLANLISQDLKQIVFTAMRQLRPRHREVLTMRCYEEMEYSQIAKMMDCSEFGVRMLFCRAKKSLAKQLSRNGLSKGALLSSLVLFGRMTAPSEAAAAEISVTSASLKAGIAAGLLGGVGIKTAVVSLTAAGALTVGTIATRPATEPPAYKTQNNITQVMPAISHAAPGNLSAGECWFYYPEDINGAVMTRLVQGNGSANHSYTRWLQNDQANYLYDQRKSTTYITNHRIWRSDLAVWRLPSDSPELCDFLDLVEGNPRQMPYIKDLGKGLLVVTRQNGDNSTKVVRTTYHRNILEEEYFCYPWPGDVKVVDQRDEMHKQGWCYFRVEGNLGGETISGVGRIPFLYGTYRAKSPWLTLQIGERLVIVDSNKGAYINDFSGQALVRYPAGSFFGGLLRPWMGLHTIDTVRRDAAQKQLWFETRCLPKQRQAKVVLNREQTKLTYVIDIEKDLIEKITFSAAQNLGGEREGVLTFTYSADTGRNPDEFRRPQRQRYGGSVREAPGVLWIFQLMEGTSGK